MNMPASTAGGALRPTRFPYKNGLVLLHNRAAANPSVVVRALVRAGASRETPGDHGVASLTGRMLRQGTANFQKNALAEELDGAAISGAPWRSSVNWSNDRHFPRMSSSVYAARS
jgi:hypothetical protein